MSDIRKDIRNMNQDIRDNTSTYDEIQFNIDCLKNGGLEKFLTPQHESEFLNLPIIWERLLNYLIIGILLKEIMKKAKKLIYLKRIFQNDQLWTFFDNCFLFNICYWNLLSIWKRLTIGVAWFFKISIHAKIGFAFL